MLALAHHAGRAAALARFGIKQADAAPPLPQVAPKRSFGDHVKEHAQGFGRAMVGHPDKLLDSTSWKGDGMFNAKNVLWPSVKGQGVSNWMGRAATGLAAYDAYQAVRGKGGDPREGRLTNMLGSLGSAAGNLMGYPMVGMLGAPLMGSLGRRLGVGLGRTLGSRAAPPPPPPPQEFEGYP